MNWINIAGILGIVFFVFFLGWFICHPISRDRVLVKFGWKYFLLLLCIMLSSISVIALSISSNNTCPCQESIVMSNPVDGTPWLTAMQYCVKMLDAESTNLKGGTVFAIMLFQIIVFEGLILAAIVGWTSRRTKRFQKGQVRYKSILAFNGWIAWLYDKFFDSLRNCCCVIWNIGVKIVDPMCKTKFQLYVVDWSRVFKKWERYKYAVVIGGNEVAPSVIKNLLMREEDKENSLNYVHEKENQYVILQTSSEIGEVRQTLKAYLTEEEYNRVIIYSDIRYSYEGLKALHLEEASEIYVLGENTTIDGGETYHDTMNMRCVNLMAEVLGSSIMNGRRKTRNRLEIYPKKILKWLYRCTKYDTKVCKVLFEYQTTYSVFQFSDVTADVKRVMHFIPFNRYESWARRVMVDNRALALVDENDNSKSNQQITYKPLDGYEGIKPNDTQRVHFIVVGMSKMGVAMGTQALFQAHYPNYVRDNNLKSRITFIDANAEQEMQFFKGRYASLFELARHRYIDAKECKDALLNSGYKWIDPMLDSKTKWKHLSAGGQNFLDVEIEFIKGELESEGVREYLRQVTADKRSKVTIAICLPLTHQSVAAALYMPNEVYDNVQEIWVYQREAADIIQNLTQGKEEELNIRYKKLKPFGMLYGEYIDSRTYYLKALLVNGIYDIEDVDSKMYSSNIDMGDKTSYKPLRTSWNNLTVEKTWSNKYFVDTIYQKIRSIPVIPILKNPQNSFGYNGLAFHSIGFLDMLKEWLIDNKEYLAPCEHNRWNVQQLLLGFRPASEQVDKDICKEQEEVKQAVAPIKREIGNFMNADNIKRLKELNNQIHYTKGDVEAKSFKSLLKFIEANEKLEVDAEVLDKIKEMAQKEEKIAAKKKNLEKKKKDLKSPKNKVHYCICDFNHLEAVDCDAKRYDEKLNNGIPTILKLVDGYKTLSWYIFRMKYAISELECKENVLEILKSDILAEINDVAQYLNSKEYLNHLTKNKRI